jgi:N-methylhydantoinase B
MSTTGKIKITRNIDPTTFSVVWNKFEYIVEQACEKVLYSTQSFVTALVRDLGASLQDARGRLVVASAHLPVHTLIAETAMKGVNGKFGTDYQPGDYIIANDPYIVKAGHLPDWSFIKPTFYKGELIGFLQCKTHVADTGGFLPGGYGPGAYDIIAEGLNIPPLKMIKAGVVDKDLWEFLLKNVRNPNQVEMDAKLINGVLTQAEGQLCALCDKYGVETVKACMGQIIAAGEKAMRAEIEQIPDGTYSGESVTDWDGTTDKPVWVRVKAIVKGDEMTFDFSESDPQVTFVNSPFGNTYMYAMIAVYYTVSPTVPKNSGSMAPVHLIAPEGSVVNPIFPATVGACPVNIGCQIGEACLLALGKAVPDKALAGWGMHCCPINIGVEPRVIDPRTGKIKQYFAEHFASDAGSGGVKGYDGWPGVVNCGSGGNFMRPNIENYELEVPFRVLNYEVLQDWEGAGEFRGSPGTCVVFVADTAEGAPSYLMTGNSDSVPRPGVAGGGDSPAVEMYIDSPNGKRRVLRTKANEPVYPGEIITTKVPGGGGWGDPLNRNVEKVRDDVMDGVVSLQRAREVYGVLLAPETFEIHYEATQKLRNELKAEKN